MNTPSAASAAKTQPPENPNYPNRSASIPLILLILVAISSVLLILVGGSLFLFPSFSQSRWVWPLTPFNTRFLAAIYLSALTGLSSLLLTRSVSLTRSVVPMMWVFTTVVLMVSCLQIGQFNAARRATDIWFWLYLIDCVGASYYLGYYRHRSFANLSRVPQRWTIYLRSQALFLGLYGLFLLLSPNAMSGLWPWPLDTFHTQLYSAIFLTGAVGSVILSRQTTAIEQRVLGAVQVTFSSLVLLGVLIVDRAVQKIDWSAVGTWVWVGAIVFLGIAGIALIQQSFISEKASEK